MIAAGERRFRHASGAFQDGTDYVVQFADLPRPFAIPLLGPAKELAGFGPRVVAGLVARGEWVEVQS